jgi:excisionase family DNA binding protein
MASALLHLFSMENELKPLRLLTIKETAVLLRMSQRTVQRLIHRKELPSFKLRGQWRLRESEVVKWVEGLREL